MDNKDLRVNELCGTVIELSMKRRIFGIGNEEKTGSPSSRETETHSQLSRIDWLSHQASGRVTR